MLPADIGEEGQGTNNPFRKHLAARASGTRHGGKSNVTGSYHQSPDSARHSCCDGNPGPNAVENQLDFAELLESEDACIIEVRRHWGSWAGTNQCVATSEETPWDVAH